MVTPEVRAQFARRGVELIEPEIGRRRFVEELLYGRKGEVEVVMGGGTWLEQVDPAELAALSQPATAPAASMAAGGTPLLRPGMAIDHTPDGGVEATYLLDARRDLYLFDHCLEGQPVLPYAMALELMAEVAAWGWPSLHVSHVQGLRLLQGIVLERLASPAGEEDGAEPQYSTRELQVTARPVSLRSGGGQDVEVTISTRVPVQRIHYRGVVTLLPALPAAPADTSGPLAAATAFPLSLPDAYRQWLFHGPRMAGIAAVDAIGERGITGSLIPSSPQRLLAGGATGAWQIDPVVVDSGLQLLLLWTRRTLDMTGLPASLSTYHRFGPLADPQLRCELRLHPETGMGPALRCDIAFVGTGGRLLGLMETMEVTVSKALNRLTGRDD
jgi:hypothetical protein